MRLFIAIELPAEIRDQIETHRRALAAALPDPGRVLRWVGPEQFHLTLKFLGNIFDENLAGFKTALELAAQQHSPFDLRFNGVGSFSHGNNVRVIWLGADQGGPESQALARDVEEACEELGVPKEARDFHLHLTLARAKEAFPLAALEKATKENPWPAIGPVHVDKLSLIESVLSRSGPTYTTLHEESLGRPSAT